MAAVTVAAREKRFAEFVRPVRRALHMMLRYMHADHCAVEVMLVGNRVLGKNVLAFPADPDFPRPDHRGRFLGELYLNPAVIVAENGNVVRMLAHGLLHLLGYDHKRRADIIRMERKERKLQALCKDIS